MELPIGVRFRVRKGAKFLFECAIARRDDVPTDLQQYVVRADEMDLLRDAEIVIAKRLKIVEVDRMIACCRQHPPQTLVAPVESDATGSERAAFADLAVYLRQRERAGVGSIGPGMLVMLIPLPDRNDYFRCQIVNAATTVGEIGAQVSTVFTPAVDQQPAETLSAEQEDSPPAPPVPCPQEAPTEGTATDNAPDSVETQGNNVIEHENEHDPSVTATEPEENPFAKLRYEYAAFYAFYHHVLLEWSTKPSDIDSAQDLDANK